MTMKKALFSKKMCKYKELQKSMLKQNRSESETQHIFIKSATVLPKLVAMGELMTEVRANDNAIVYDVMDIDTYRFYRSDKCILLNPFDDCSSTWSPFAESHSSVGLKTNVVSLIKKDK